MRGIGWPSTNTTKNLILVLTEEYNCGSPHFILIQRGFCTLPHKKAWVFHAFPTNAYIFALYSHICFLSICLCFIFFVLYSTKKCRLTLVDSISSIMFSISCSLGTCSIVTCSTTFLNLKSITKKVHENTSSTGFDRKKEKHANKDSKGFKIVVVSTKNIMPCVSQ